MYNFKDLAMSRIYTFTNGLKVDLRQIICIGAIDKSASNVIFIPVFCKGYNKPIEITLGHAIGRVEEAIKEKITMTYNDFVEHWNLYIIEQK